MSSTVVAREATTTSVPGRRGRIRRPIRRPTGRRLLVSTALIAALAAGGWFGLDWWNNGRFIQSTDDAYVGGNVTPIAPHVAGFIESVLVTDNQRVAAGQVLVRLDARTYRAAEAHAQAVVAARRAALESLRAQTAEQAAVIRQQEADLAARAAQAVFTEADAARYRSLAVAAAGTRQDQQRSTAADQAARAAVVAANAGLEAARHRAAALAAQTDGAVAAVQQAEADLQTAQLDVGWTEVRSPIDGFVGNRAAQVGAYASAGTYLVSVVPAQGLWVDANFKEDQLAALRPGAVASVAADVLPGHVFRGHIASFAPGTGGVFSVIPPENATGNFTKIVQRVPVRVLLDAGDPLLPMLRPGLSATVGVDTRAP